MPAGPAIEVAHVRAQAGLVHHRDFFQFRMRLHLAVVGIDVRAIAGRIEQIAIRFAARANARANGRRILEHAHRIAGRRDAVDFDVFFAGAEVFLLDVVGQAAFGGHGKARGDLNGAGAFFEEADGIRTGEHATGGNHRDAQLLGLHERMDLVHDRVQVVLLPVIHAEAQVATGQRTFDDDEVGLAVQARDFAQEQLQRAHGRNDDAQVRIAETRVILDQLERTQVQAGRQRDAVDAAVQGRRQAHAQRFLRRVHGQLFHAVHVDQAIAFLRFHGGADMTARGLGQVIQIELDHGLVHVVDVELVGLGFFLDVRGVELAVGHVLRHCIGDMADPAQAGCFQRQLGRRNVHTHSADHDGHVFLVAHAQAEIINTFHCYP